MQDVAASLDEVEGLFGVFSGTQMLRIRKFGEMPCGYDPSRGRKADAAEGRAVVEFSFSLPRLRHNGISPRLCKRHSLNVRDSLLFNRLMRNFKRNQDFHEREGRNFDRIELDSRSAKRGDSRRPRSRAEKMKIPTARRRSHTDSVETSRTTNVVCVPLKTSTNPTFATWQTRDLTARSPFA